MHFFFLSNRILNKLSSKNRKNFIARDAIGIDLIPPGGHTSLAPSPRSNRSRVLSLYVLRKQLTMKFLLPFFGRSKQNYSLKENYDRFHRAYGMCMPGQNDSSCPLHQELNLFWYRWISSDAFFSDPRHLEYVYLQRADRRIYTFFRGLPYTRRTSDDLQRDLICVYLSRWEYVSYFLRDPFVTRLSYEYLPVYL